MGYFHGGDMKAKPDCDRLECYGEICVEPETCYGEGQPRDLTPERLTELRRIAQAATPGPWRMHDLDDSDVTAYITSAALPPIMPDLAEVRFADDARYIAAFSPPTVLALLDRVEHLEHKVVSQRLALQRLQDAHNRLLSDQRLALHRLQDARNYLVHARAEAERYREQYEELRASVGAVADRFGRRATDAWEAWHLHLDLDAQYAAPVWEEAEQMVRALLDEAGGGGDGPSRQDQEPTA